MMIWKTSLKVLLICIACSPTISSDIPVHSSKLDVIVNGNMELEFHIKERQTRTLEIHPSPTMASNVSQETVKESTIRKEVSPSKQAKKSVSKGVLTQVYDYDKSVVELFRYIMKDSERISNMSSEHQNAIQRYVKEWDELIYEPGPERDQEDLIPELEVRPFTLPKAAEKWYKYVRMILRVSIELPVILKLNTEPFWAEVETKAIMEEIRYGKYMSLSVIQLVANNIITTCRTYFAHPLQMYSENITEKIPVMDVINLAVYSTEKTSYKEPLKWISFAKDLLTKRFSSLKSVHEDANNQGREDSLHDSQTDLSFGGENSRMKMKLIYVNILRNIYAFKHDLVLIMKGHLAPYQSTFPEFLSKVDEVEQSEKTSIRRRRTMTPDQQRFLIENDICTGNDLRDVKSKAGLRCSYDRLNAPWLYLMPAKVEVLHSDPRITFVHNIITENKIKTLQALSFPLLHEMLVEGPESSVQRVTHNALLPQNFHQDIYDLALISEYVSGLNVRREEEDSKLFKMNAYLPGEYFQTHYDVTFSNREYMQKNETERQRFLREILPMGRRISTLLFYLNDVEEGGITAFTGIGLPVRPEKGGILFFSTLNNSGDLDSRLQHAGCPVVSGTKWVMAKCIYYNAQLYKRPCPLKREFAP